LSCSQILGILPLSRDGIVETSTLMPWPAFDSYSCSLASLTGD
jgi:hypothetical protein